MTADDATMNVIIQIHTAAPHQLLDYMYFEWLSYKYLSILKTVMLFNIIDIFALLQNQILTNTWKLVPVMQYGSHVFNNSLMIVFEIQIKVE